MTLAEKAYVEGIKARAAKQRLEAAAPEMLEALRLAIPHVPDSIAVQLRAAIAKAEGESK